MTLSDPIFDDMLVDNSPEYYSVVFRTPGPRGRYIDFSYAQIHRLGEAGLKRKLLRFRRYARREERIRARRISRNCDRLLGMWIRGIHDALKKGGQ